MSILISMPHFLVVEGGERMDKCAWDVGGGSSGWVADKD